MKHESQNPLYARFKHLLSHADRYPAEHVDIFWNLTGDDAPRVKDVEVVFVPREALSDDELKAEYVRYNRQWGSDLGNSTQHWLEEGGYTPEGVFEHLLHYGFASEADTRRALEEFAHIEECEWARLILRGLKDQ
jgi:hypothetical protein